MAKKQFVVYLKTSKKRNKTLLTMISIDSKESISFMGEVSNPQKKHENLSIKDSFNRGVMWLNPGDGTVDIDPPKK